jgi:hypothetical protein
MVTRSKGLTVLGRLGKETSPDALYCKLYHLIACRGNGQERQTIDTRVTGLITCYLPLFGHTAGSSSHLKVAGEKILLTSAVGRDGGRDRKPSKYFENSYLTKYLSYKHTESSSL